MSFVTVMNKKNEIQTKFHRIESSFKLKEIIKHIFLFLKSTQFCCGDLFINITMEITTKSAVQSQESEYQDFPVHQGTSFSDQKELLFQPTCSNDDPFGLTSCQSQVNYVSNRVEAQSFEEDLKLLTNGQEEVLIKNYEKKLKQGETKNLSKPQKEFQKQTYEKIGQTKNIPKNFGKQIIKFVKKNREIVEKILLSGNSLIKYDELNSQLQKRKLKMNRIQDLRALWVEKFSFSRQMRIISIFFMRSYGLNWIFNSRIEDFGSHIKYRRALIKLIQKPEQFTNLKIAL